MPPPTDFRWSAKASRYVDARGRFVSRAAVRGALDAAVQREGQRMTALTQQLRDRTISLADWQAGMRESIKASHLYATAAARGGWAQMAPADVLRAGRAIRQQYGYLQTLARDLAAGRVPVDGRLAQRARLYAQASRAAFHTTERLEQGERNGMTEERNLLAPADHCESCLAATAAGWVPIGTLPLPGSADRVCRQNCKCRLEYRAA